MKTIFAMIVFSLVSVSFSPQAQDSDSRQNEPSDQSAQQDIFEFPNQEAPPPYEDEDDTLMYDQEIFSRKLFQKSLPKLTKKETIVWAFRMADPDPYL